MNTNPDTSKTGVLVSNLGTPDAPTPEAVKRYLAQFLSDQRVIHIPKLLWWPVLHGIILRKRPPDVARNYAKVWTDAGSPLLVYSRQINDGIRDLLNTQGVPVPVVLGMRYGNPSIPAALRELREAGAQRLVVLPLYPQFSYTTTASTADDLHAGLQRLGWNPELRFIDDYHTDSAWITALADSVRSFQSEHGKPQRLLLSFHGLPQNYADAGDPYPEQCEASAQLLAQALGLGADAWAMTYQSRFGPRQWLQPYTEPTLVEWAGQGITDVQVMCPGFPADCLETLEEIAMQAGKAFVAAGGKSLRYIPALNADPAHIAALADLVRPDW